MSSIELHWCSRAHIFPECDVLHVCLTHCLIPALGLVWFVAVHLCGRQQYSRKGVLQTEMGLKGELCPRKTHLDSGSCKLLAFMLMDKRVVLNKRRDWSFASGVGHWVARLGCYSHPAKAPDTILYLTWLNFSSHNKSQISVFLCWWYEALWGNTVSF